MRRLLLYRHAKSSWDDPTVSDHDRALSNRGLKAAPRMGRMMAEQGYLPDLIICSTALRTRETLRLTLPALLTQKLPQVRFEAAIYEAGPHALEGAIRAHGEDCESVMLVGHNPGMQMLALLLAAQSADQSGTGAHDRLSEKYPTAGLAVIDLAITCWSEIKPGCGRLIAFVTPRMLQAQ